MRKRHIALENSQSFIFIFVITIIHNKNIDTIYKLFSQVGEIPTTLFDYFYTVLFIQNGVLNYQGCKSLLVKYKIGHFPGWTNCA